MDVQITKGKDRDYIQAYRIDGSAIKTMFLKTTFPKKGWFPHDAVHLIVEKQLRFQFGFWGRVFGGATPEEIGEMAKVGGHASSSRSSIPDEDIIELLHAERIVECFEAELWSEPADIESFMSVLNAACSQSKVSEPHLSHEDIHAIRAELKRTMITWRGLAIGESLNLKWALSER